MSADTSRRKKSHEQDSREYHFVPREEMERGIINHRYTPCLSSCCRYAFLVYNFFRSSTVLEGFLILLHVCLSSLFVRRLGRNEAPFCLSQLYYVESEEMHVGTTFSIVRVSGQQLLCNKNFDVLVYLKCVKMCSNCIAFQDFMTKFI